MNGPRKRKKSVSILYFYAFAVSFFAIFLVASENTKSTWRLFAETQVHLCFNLHCNGNAMFVRHTKDGFFLHQ